MAFAIGHIQNDMTASCWFSYLLVFLHTVPNLTPLNSAIVMFSGQVGDAFATPLVGLCSDFSKGIPSLRMGPRKSWIAGGGLVVAMCFTFVFTVDLPQLLFDAPSVTLTVVYYSVTATLFNFGWAANQVCHMALIPELSPCPQERCVLSSRRYSFTIVASVATFIAFGAILHFEQPANVPNANKFALLGAICIIVGGPTLLLFLICCCEPYGKAREEALKNKSCFGIQGEDDISMAYAEASNSPVRPTMQRRAGKDGGGAVGAVRVQWWEWFYRLFSYQVAYVYMVTRLVINLTQVYTPFFLMFVLECESTAIAIIPCLVYLSSWLATFAAEALNKRLGRLTCWCIGGLINLVSLALAWFLEPHSANWMYASAVLLGVGNSLIMVTSVSLEADLVGENFESGAFVYGAMSFVDKLSNGIAVLTIQQMRNHVVQLGNLGQDRSIIRASLCIVPSVAIVSALMVVLQMKCELSNKGHIPTKPEEEPLLDGGERHENYSV